MHRGPGRAGEHATALVGDYNGIIQRDGYAAYKQLADPARNQRPAPAHG